MTLEFEFMGLYFSSIVPRFLLCLAVWYPFYQLFGALRLQRWVYFPALFHLSVFFILMATIILFWHPSNFLPTP